MLETIFKKKRKLFAKTTFFLIVSVFFLTGTTSGQEVFVRVSENDCVNCYTGFFSELIKNPHNKEFKFLFPENYKGKRFENFNKLYFQNKLSLDRVKFSDSLFEISKDPLNDLSGIILFYKNNLISSIGVESINNDKINVLDHLNSMVDSSVLLNLQQEGVSERINIAASYNTNHFAVSDFMYRTLYFWNSQKTLSTIDFKDEGFQQILKDGILPDKYESHRKNRERLRKNGNEFPEVYSLSFSDNELVIGFAIPHIFLNKIEDGQEQYYTMPLLNFSFVPLASDDISVAKIIENSYIEDRSELEYIIGLSSATFNKEIYRVNQLMYNSNDFEKNRTFPLLNKLKVSNNKKERILIYENVNGLENFAFQQDTLLNKHYLMDIQFVNQDQYILLNHYPYAIDLVGKKKYKLDWDVMLNTHYYPTKTLYDQIQFWKTSGGFNVLVKKDGLFYLKSYSENWKFVSEKTLPFNSQKTTNIRFTKKWVFLFTKEEIIVFPNVFEA